MDPCCDVFNINVFLFNNQNLATSLAYLGSYGILITCKCTTFYKKSIVMQKMCHPTLEPPSIKALL